MDAPWGVCAVERQYWDRQASLARPFDSADGRFDLQLTWFAGVDLGVSETSGVRARRRQEGARGTGVEHGGAGLSEMANLAAVELFRIDRSETAKPRSIRLSTTGPRGVSIATPTSPASPAANDSGHPSRPPARGDRGNGRDARTLDAALRTDPHCLRPLELEVRFASPPCSACRLRRCFSSRRRL